MNKTFLGCFFGCIFFKFFCYGYHKEAVTDFCSGLTGSCFVTIDLGSVKHYMCGPEKIVVGH